MGLRGAEFKEVSDSGLCKCRLALDSTIESRAEGENTRIPDDIV